MLTIPFFIQCSLIDPEAAATDFKISFITQWPELNGSLQNPLLGHETHKLEFEVDVNGNEAIRITRNGVDERRTAAQTRPLFGPIRGRLRYFGQGLPPAERGRGGDAESDWNVGIRLFRDGCRVRPYGEPGSEGDWLQIYRARYLKGSRFRLKPHYLEGTIHISKDSNPLLRDTTSREGLESNDAYSTLVEYIRDKVSQLSDLLREEELKDERSRMTERYKKALHPLTGGLSQIRSDEYKKAAEDADKLVKKGLQVPPAPSTIRNAHWECLDCSDSWKVPRDLMPTQCREFSVGRDGRPSKKPGCGSPNIRRKENVPRDGPKPLLPPQPLDDVLAGMPAYVSGTQLKPLIDWEMGENDEEAEVRPAARELAINGRHRSFRAADLLDGNETVEGTSLEALRAVAALTIHVIDSASQAWGRWHYKRSNGKFEEFLTNANALKNACLDTIKST